MKIEVLGRLRTNLNMWSFCVILHMCKGLAGSYLCVIVLENLLCTRFTACNYDNKSFWVTPTTYAARTLLSHE